MAFQPTDSQVNNSQLMLANYQIKESSCANQFSNGTAQALGIATSDRVYGIVEKSSIVPNEEEITIAQTKNFIGSLLVRGSYEESTYAKHTSNLQQQTLFSQFLGSVPEKTVHSDGISISDLLNLSTCQSLEILEHRQKVDTLVEKKLQLCYLQRITACHQQISDFEATPHVIRSLSQRNKPAEQFLDLLLNTFHLMPNDDGKSSKRQRKQMDAYHQLLLSYQQVQAHWQSLQDSARLIENSHQKNIDAFLKLPGFISQPPNDLPQPPSVRPALEKPL